MLDWILKEDNWIFVLVIGLCVLLALLIAIWVHRRRIRIERKIKRLAAGTLEMTPKEFLAMRAETLGKKEKKLYAETKEFSGVYILFNKKKNKYYVGQGERILQRVNSHFTGKGNGDVYADYKYGDPFTIRMIALKGSGFKSLNELERHTIKTYDAFSKGYNKTRGNR